jgi:hypothetical protein
VNYKGQKSTFDPNNAQGGLDRFGNSDERIDQYELLREAILELYLSVKIRADEEIDNFTEAQLEKEKEGMKEVDGFTIVEYIKNSIEIMMNMKIEEQNDKKKSKHPIDSLSGTSSTSSIPAAHEEYEKILRQLEAESRQHIQVEQQMKIHIECLQDKLDANSKKEEEVEKEQKKLKRVMAALEEDLASKMEQVKKVQKEAKKEKEELEETIKGLRKDLDRAIALQKSVEQIGFQPEQEEQSYAEFKKGSRLSVAHQLKYDDSFDVIRTQPHAKSKKKRTHSKDNSVPATTTNNPYLVDSYAHISRQLAQSNVGALLYSQQVLKTIGASQAVIQQRIEKSQQSSARST